MTLADGRLQPVEHAVQFLGLVGGCVSPIYIDTYPSEIWSWHTSLCAKTETLVATGRQKNN